MYDFLTVISWQNNFTGNRLKRKKSHKNIEVENLHICFVNYTLIPNKFKMVDKMYLLNLYIPVIWNDSERHTVGFSKILHKSMNMKNAQKKENLVGLLEAHYYPVV